MGIIKLEDISGIYDSNGIGGIRILCDACMGSVDLDKLKQTDIITSYAVEQSEDAYFCDECQKKLQ